MDGIMRGIHACGCYQRLAYLTTTIICILCCVPVNGLVPDSDNLSGGKTIAHEILSQINTQNTNSVIEEFNKLEEVLDSSSDPLADGRNFLQTFIREVNDQYSLNLTIQDACKLVRDNLHTLNIPEEFQTIILATIDLYASDTPTAESKIEELKKHTHAAKNASWPWAWNWFGLNKKKHNHKHKDHRAALSNSSTLLDKELPSNCYIGGCELLAGALVCILPFPGAAWLGVAMMGDGSRRVIDGSMQLSDERRSDPNYVAPPNPPGFNFR